MAALKGTLARLLVDEYDFSGETNTFTVTLAMNEEDCTVLTSTAAEYTGVLAAINITQDGYMVATGEGSLEKELWDRLGVQGSYVAALVGINNTNCPAYVLDSTFGASMEIAAPATSIITVNGSWGQGKGGHRGYRIFSGQINGTGNLAAVDFGAPGTGGEAYVFVSAITGTASGAQIIIQSSTTSGGAYTNRGTINFSGLGSYKVALNATDQWIRANVGAMGGATNFTVTIIACSRGVTE